MRELLIHSREDINFEQNKKWIESRLVRGSEVQQYETRRKSHHDTFDNQSSWLIVRYLKDEVEFTTVLQSHKNNQHLNIKKGH